MTDDESIITVTGCIEPEELGVTLPHEHLFVDSSAESFRRPESGYERRIAEEPISMEQLWWIRQNPYSHRENLRMTSYDDAVEEVRHYYRAGGSSLVDVSPKNKGGDPRRVRAVSRETGVTIVHGTAFYTREAHPERLERMSADDIAAEFVSDVQTGIDDTDVRAGIIGEIGVTGDEHPDADYRFIHPAEEKVLRAGARAALETGVAVSVHPPSERSPEYPTSRRSLQVLDLLEEEGLSLERVILCHRDQSKWLEADLTYQREIAERGAYVEFDLFGHDDAYHVAFDDAQGSDRDRAKWIGELVDDGFADRLLLSHDIYLKHFLRKYGGFGYAHILESIVPTLRAMGVSQRAVDTMLVDNPKRILTVRGSDRS